MHTLCIICGNLGVTPHHLQSSLFEVQQEVRVIARHRGTTDTVSYLIETKTEERGGQRGRSQRVD